MKWVRRTFIVLTALYWILILVLTHLPPNDLPKVPTSDKVAHFLAYFGLGMSVGVTVLILRPHWRWLPLGLIVLGMSYGAFDELTQPLFRRDAEWGDWRADTSGTACAALIIFIVQWSIHRKRRVSDSSVELPPAATVTAERS